MFNATIDDLEEGCPDVQDSSVSSDWQSIEGESSNEEGPLSSTPSRPGRGPVFLDSPVLERRGKAAKRLEISMECRQTVPEEPNTRTEAKWLARLAELLRYIDDGFGLLKVNFENSFGFEVNGVFHRIKHAVQSQNLFRHLVKEAENIGMVVNAKKTSMLCVSDSLSYTADAFILDADQGRIGCQEKMKALGLYFSSRPTMAEQGNSIARQFRSRYWTLRNLKNSGFTQEELVTVYTTMIRPIADYRCVVYHSSLTDEQDEILDGLQNHALKCICLLYTSPSPRDRQKSRMPSSA